MTSSKGLTSPTAELSQEQVDIYKPLATDEIRLVRLQPGRSDDVVSCELQHWSLDQCPPYYAISYAWGKLSESNKIMINGTERDIGVGLHKALVLFRQTLSDFDPDSAPTFANKTFESFWIWADSLCLNQSNEKEKESQIPRMGEIFGRAEHVIAWLGENKKDEEEGVQLLMKLCLLEAPAVEEPWDDELYQNKLYKMIADDMEKFVRTLFELLLRPFFSRIWIIQEMSLGRRDPILLAGRYWFTLSSLSRIWKFGLKWGRGAQYNVVFTSFHYHVNTFLDLRNLHQTDLGIPNEENDEETIGWRLNRYLRPVGEAFESSWPHDQLYGLLGIAGVRELPECLKPNYSRPYGEVYRDYTRVCLEYCGDLSLLDRLDSSVTGVPSWVPDYRIHSWTRTHDDWDGLEFLPGDKLRVHGIILESCLDGWSPKIHLEEKDQEARLKAKIKSLHALFTAAYEAGNRPLEEIVRSYINIAYWLQGMLDDFTTVQDSLLRSLVAGEYIQPDSWHGASAGVRFCLNYPVIATNKGAVHKVIRQDVTPKTGDVVCALQGACTPVLLRRGLNNEYTFLGMVQMWDGEAVVRFTKAYFEGKELQSFELI